MNRQFINYTILFTITSESEIAPFHGILFTIMKPKQHAASQLHIRHPNNIVTGIGNYVVTLVSFPVG